MDIGNDEDHLSLQLISPKCTVDVIMAIPDTSRDVYVGLTGNRVALTDIGIK